MNKDKSNAYNDWFSMVFKSWTWDKLTQKEKDVFIDLAIQSDHEKVIKGDYKNRWQILNTLYHAYLLGLGYKSIGWREEPTTLF